MKQPPILIPLIKMNKNICDVIRPGFHLLKNEEHNAIALKDAIQEGVESGIAHEFHPERNLQELKEKKRKNG